ncbi:MAG TPA: ATP-binding protein [Rhodocyclaceae bacterium]|nr:ATP-binding protein [Rhodocyclaceae bacterium]
MSSHPSATPSLGDRLRAALLGVAATVVALYASFSLLIGLREVVHLAEIHLETLAQIASRNLANTGLVRDDPGVNDLLHSLDSDTSLISARLLDLRGSEISAYRNGDGRQREFDWLPASWNRITVVHAVAINGEKKASLELTATLDRFWATAFRAGAVWMFVTVLALMVAGVAARRLQRSLTAPIERLEAITRDIAENKRFSLRVESATDDEIGRFTRSFNRMLQEIESRDAILERQRLGLENQISNRTHELLSAKESAEEATRVKSRFLAAMSHEIRTPLHGILGMIRLLRASPLQPEQQHLAVSAHQSGETLLKLLDDVLDFSRLEAQRIQVEHQPYGIANIVEGAGLILAENAQSKGLELIVSLAPDLPVRAYGDASHLQQVLLNLLGNAIKFTGRGEIVLSAGVVPGRIAGESGLRFEVSDTGIGIAEADRARLFEAFHRGQHNTGKPQRGVGLGLAIASELVELMGGKLEFSSTLHQGSSFWFELPLHVAEEAPPKGLPILAGKHVLIALDNLTLASTLKNYVQAEGGIPHLANHAAMARELLFGSEIWHGVISERPFWNGSEMPPRSFVSGLPIWIDLIRLGEHLPSAPGHRHLLKPVSKRALIPLLANDGHDALDDSSMSAPLRFNAKILLVDDQPTNLEVGRGLLELLGCEVTVASDGHRFLQLACSRDFDLILMDCQMPGMDGAEATIALRQQEEVRRLPPTAVIALSADDAPETQRRCIEAGMNGFLKKPLREEALIGVLRDWLS